MKTWRRKRETIWNAAAPSFQVACLVIVGAAFLFSLGNLLRVDPGFDPRNVAVLNITSDAADKSDDPVFWNSSHADQEALLGKRMLRLQFAVASQPGIQDAAVAVPATSFTG
jgi:hypothetical protein